MTFYCPECCKDVPIVIGFYDVACLYCKCERLIRK